MAKITFEHVPAEIEQIHFRLERIEMMLHELLHGKEQEDNLLTVAEAAKLLDLSIPTIYSKVSRMEIAVHKPGKRLYFQKRDLIAYLAARKRQSAQTIGDDAKARFSFERRK